MAEGWTSGAMLTWMLKPLPPRTSGIWPITTCATPSCLSRSTSIASKCFVVGGKAPRDDARLRIVFRLQGGNAAPASHAAFCSVGPFTLTSSRCAHWTLTGSRHLCSTTVVHQSPPLLIILPVPVRAYLYGSGGPSQRRAFRLHPVALDSPFTTVHQFV